MKRILSIACSIFFVVMALAQPEKPSPGPINKGDPPKVEKMVSGLTAIQKKRLENITEKSKKEVLRLRSELESVRNQIGSLNSKDGDKTDIIFPLFDREGELMAEISKEMYRCRLQIDEVLTPEQLKEFRSSLEAERKQYMRTRQLRQGLYEKPKRCDGASRKKK